MVELGKYIHYKGKEYTVTGTGIMSAQLQQVNDGRIIVDYEDDEGNKFKAFIEDFEAIVGYPIPDFDGDEKKMVQRFTKLEID